MKHSKLFLLALLILPWLSIPLLGKPAFKKYLPSALFICTFTKAIDIFGENNKWWKFYKGLPPLNSMNFFNFGPYLITSLWILKLTYRKFFIYMLSNTTLHILFTYFGLKYVKRFKIFSLVELTKFQYLIIDIIRAVLLYSFQRITDLSHGKELINKNE
ncbi:hypothetical protein [Pullulanibacillus camelliae]|nr:hypothetical protein [Pullulanibacillus camelliae]